MKIIYDSFIKKIEEYTIDSQYSGVFYVIDKYLYSLLDTTVKSCFVGDNLMLVEAKEESKSISKAMEIWQWLIDKNANRQSLIVNIGGGIISDLGGFVASTFMRGCCFVNVPTTLLAMVDASIGGKTGVNFGGLKNEVGTFADPKEVIIDVSFLELLPQSVLYDGYAEMLKYGFIAEENLLDKTYQLNLQNINHKAIVSLIKSDIKVKKHLARIDKYDLNERRALNFGHTFGHAFEAFAAKHKQTITHGTAVAWGMIGELYLSLKMLGLPKNELVRLHTFVKYNYKSLSIGCSDFDEIVGFMQHDKKNASPQGINFTLLESIGQFHCNQKASKTDVYEALDYLFC